MAPSRDVSAERWQASRTFHHSQFTPERVAVERATVAEELLAAIAAAA